MLPASTHAVSPTASNQELIAAHDQLRAAMQLLEVETARVAPDRATLATVRLKLAQASRRRAIIVDQLLATEAGSRSGTALAQIIALRDSVRQARAASTAHIARWTPTAVEADWRGYCLASATLRRIMRQQMTSEAAVLTPRA